MIHNLRNANNEDPGQTARPNILIRDLFVGKYILQHLLILQTDNKSPYLILDICNRVCVLLLYLNVTTKEII